MDGRQARSVWLRLAFKLLVLLLVGTSVGLCAKALPEADGLKRLVTHEGWPTVVFLVTILVVVADFVMEGRAQSKETSAREVLVEKIVVETSRNLDTVLATLVKVHSAAIAFPKASASLNVHLYIAEKLDGRIVLRKRRDLGTNFEVFPAGHTLDYADPAVDGLAICHAYNSDSVVYTLVDPSHTYNDRIDNRVDRGIGWVMGVPIHHIDNPPFGVICAFGKKPPFPSVEARRLFEQNLVELASVVATGLCVGEKIRAV